MRSGCLLIVFIMFVLSCSREKEPDIIPYRQVAVEKCLADTANTYHYILPENPGGKLPLVLILDSGGDGLLAVNKAEPAVSKIPCVVVGSDLIRNNFPGYGQAIQNLIADACNKFPVNTEQIYLAGFSGGARMAFEYARKYAVQGVLMCSAGPSVPVSQHLPCPVYMIAGTTDFNFSELYYNPLNHTEQQQFLSDYFRGSHEWPPSHKLEEGFLYLLGKSVPHAKNICKTKSKFLTIGADSLLAANEFLFTIKAVEKALCFNPDNREAQKMMKKIKEDNRFRENIRKIESDLAFESKINQQYAMATLERDSVWWAKEIKALSKEIADNLGEKQDHFLRIKGFLGIVLYSRLNELIRSHPEDKQIIHLLATYRMLEPENPDMYYDYALFNLKTGNNRLCKKYLTKALSLGFTDRRKLNTDFPASFLSELSENVKGFSAEIQD